MQYMGLGEWNKEAHNGKGRRLVHGSIRACMYLGTGRRNRRPMVLHAVDRDRASFPPGRALTGTHPCADPCALDCARQT